jgi:hypothetical protein
MCGTVPSLHRVSSWYDALAQVQFHFPYSHMNVTFHLFNFHSEYFVAMLTTLNYDSAIFFNQQQVPSSSIIKDPGHSAVLNLLNFGVPGSNPAWSMDVRLFISLLSWQGSNFLCLFPGRPWTKSICGSQK